LNDLVGPFATPGIDDFDAGLELMVLRHQSPLPSVENEGDGMALPVTICGQTLQQRFARRFKPAGA
jgi:hypothetical protein